MLGGYTYRNMFSKSKSFTISQISNKSKNTKNTGKTRRTRRTRKTGKTGKIRKTGRKKISILNYL